MQKQNKKSVGKVCELKSFHHVLDEIYRKNKIAAYLPNVSYIFKNK